MEKILSILIILTMLFAFSACSNETKICSNCNKENLSENSFCGFCGDLLKEPTTAELPSKDEYHIHVFGKATCLEPATCSCGKTQGTTSNHKYDEEGMCKFCDQLSPEYNDPVTIKDVFLENEIKKELEIGAEEKLTKGLLLDLYEIRIEQTITSLEGLEYAKNLNTIYFDTKSITDYSPLYKLKNLEDVNVGICLEGIDLTFLKELKHVTSLYIISEPTKESYKYLLSSPVLEELYFGVDENDDISFLSSGKNLKTLTLSCNMESSMDISVLLKLPKLKELNVHSYTDHDIDIPDNHRAVYEKLVKNNVTVDVG